MLTGSKNSIQFANVIFGNELNAWNGTYFNAPVDGVYSFKFQIHLLTDSRAFRLKVLINDGIDGVENLHENSSYASTSNSQGHTHTYIIERQMRVGDTLTLNDHYRYNYDHSEYRAEKCKTNDLEHSCSYITGRMIKKL